MPGSATALVLTALLSLGQTSHETSLPGLFQRQQILVQPGTLPKPSIWADPDTIVPRGSPVTIRCQGSLQADTYRLSRDGQYFWDMTLLNSRERGGSFTIQSMDRNHAGQQFWCRYHSSTGWSPLSEPLVLTMTGDYSPPGPSLLAQPGSVVASGGKVTLICSSGYSFQTFHLLKKGRVPMVQHMDSQYPMGRHLATFLVDPVIPSHGGTYTCYGSSSSNPHVWSQASNQVHLLVTGVHTKPSLSAHPGSPVLSGASLTLQCGSEARFDRFALTKDEQLSHPRNLDAQHSPNFTLSSVQDTDGGQYRCYGGYSLSYEWSAPSDPLDILVAGAYGKPVLSAHPGPSVTSGQNVTLQCLSALWFDTFLLFKEGFVVPLQHLHRQDNPRPFQATFILGPVTSAHGGTYRCYTSHNTSPYLLSQASDPLELVVSGGSKDQQRTTVKSDPPRSLPASLKILIGVSVGFILLLLLFLIVFFLIRQQRQRQRSAQETKTRDQPESSSPVTEVPENLYAAVKDPQPEQVELDSQVAAPEDAQEVTYAQLSNFTLRRGTSAPPSSEESNEPSVYAALATH
ncbi:PREDICTED: leukocyte immunoglobulin-like receptor subfamily B member 2 [Chrysochloris asiatica]|uniref:Leukocyte immunoglobulin-like receptor subfamily B member 2 n=1 Tax=Chrysochloris asiatica TaxID=185453 RepID=A0A9B0TWQ6_CHRAS|nr:PREDICTED: leukocyte immunoglobulin-like receptor subfamily B member 2 [Chrysochloris asiatica]